MISSIRPGHWKYVALVTIDSSSNLQGFQYCLLLPWLPGMDSEFADIRFFQRDGLYCPYWIESFTSGVSAVVWIRASAANTSELVMVYGNPLAVSDSDGASVFELFDHFDVGTLDSGKWTVVGANGTYSISNSVLAMHPTLYNEVYRIVSNYTVGSGYALRASVKTDHFASATYGERISFADASQRGQHISPAWPDVTDWSKRCTNYDGGSVTNSSNISAWSVATFHTIEIRRGATAAVYVIDALEPITLSTNYYTADGGVSLLTYKDVNAVVSIDWVGIRKFDSSEPVVTVPIHRVVAELLLSEFASGAMARNYGVIIV